ncbi:MAG: hypothetical protein JNG90_01540, partial [Planctomycetaceae bacterium]|nr:hypothetical protein [Planctomycetaceae bacterium]
MGGRPGWGYGPGNWGGYWHNHWVNPGHWGWYHGCWGGNWGNYWYVPLAYGATAWGLGALTSSWGYGYGGGYSNPYYSDAGAYYDYSQPVAMTSYSTADDTATAAPQPAADAPPSNFDQARSLFMSGDYAGAQAKIQAAIAENPKDAVAHEFNALCLFAQG